MPLMILSIVSGSVFMYNLITGICSIVFVLIFFVFNVAQIGKKMAILKNCLCPSSNCWWSYTIYWKISWDNYMKMNEG